MKKIREIYTERFSAGTGLVVLFDDMSIDVLFELGIANLDKVHIFDDFHLLMGRGNKVQIYNVIENKVVSEAETDLETIEVISIVDEGFVILFDSKKQTSLWEINPFKFVQKMDYFQPTNDGKGVFIGLSEYIKMDPSEKKKFVSLHAIGTFGSYAGKITGLTCDRNSVDQSSGIFTYNMNTKKTSISKIDEFYFSNRLSFSDVFCLKGLSPSGKYAIRSNLEKLPVYDPESIQSEKQDSYELGLVVDIVNLHSRPNNFKPVEILRVEKKFNRSGFANRDDLIRQFGLKLIEIEEKRKSGSSDVPLYKRRFLFSEPQHDLLLELIRFHSLVANIFWEPDEQAFWVLFKDCRVCRVCISGEVSKPIQFERYSDRLSYLQIQARFERDRVGFGRLKQGFVRLESSNVMEFTSPQKISIMDDGLYEVVETKNLNQVAMKNSYLVVKSEELDSDCLMDAFIDLASKLGTGFEQWKFENHLRIAIESNGEIYDENSLCDLIISRNWTELTDGLKCVLNAYLKQVDDGTYHQTWFDGDRGIGALSLLLRALILVSVDEFDTMRLFIQKRDGEHECYFREIFEEYLNKWGWRGKDSIAFGIQHAINLIWGGLGPEKYIWPQYGLFEAAKEIVKPDDFADMVVDEISKHTLAPQWNDQNDKSVYYLGTFLSSLDQNDPYFQAVVKRLFETQPETIKRLLSEKS